MQQLFIIRINDDVGLKLYATVCSALTIWRKVQLESTRKAEFIEYMRNEVWGCTAHGSIYELRNGWKFILVENNYWSN